MTTYWRPIYSIHPFMHGHAYANDHPSTNLQKCGFRSNAAKIKFIYIIYTSVRRCLGNDRIKNNILTIHESKAVVIFFFFFLSVFRELNTLYLLNFNIIYGEVHESNIIYGAVHQYLRITI